MTVVLGCNPGTRAFGIAILIDNVLVDWDVLSFRGKWSKEKLDGILDRIETLIYSFDVQHVAIKIPDVFPTSMGFNQLIGALNVLLERQGMHVHYFTLSELKKHCRPEGTATKNCIAEYIISRHSELRSRHKPGKGILSNHHFRVFEATCAAHLLRHKRDLPTEAN